MRTNFVATVARFILWMLAAFIFLILIFIPFNPHLMSQNNNNPEHEPTIIAHRGASGTAPENTMASISKAMQSEAVCIEIDVHLSKDKELVVIHDYTVNRTTNGSGKIAEMTLTEIQVLDAGSWFAPGFAGEMVPTLQEVIEFINGEKALLIEIKGGVAKYPGIAEKLIKMIQEANAGDWCIVQSFDDKTLEQIHERWPEIRLQKLFVSKLRLLPVIYDGGFSWFSFKKYHYAEALNPHYRFVNKQLVRKIQKKGFKVNVWGGKEPDSYDKIRHLPVDGWITDYP
jgi:glycerophosphoryl diester phosphodiesterase